ncbi:LysR family transcriptional regulator [Cupriavidus pauculus]|uniref:LysR family transcriptional regulator n=1 Tax=Cupriavidus pauculus TaxID=82633 RepID=A0A5P2HAN7_9BURK|nr:LysR family transcriptional regulator [Cupriavidus pauculus]QET04523.1 LysR family transcriptional regulator [Cupriavidus pauculus]
MDRIDTMRVFVRIVERGSFTAAAQDLDLPRSTVTDAIKQLEARLGVRLLQRTTRHVSATLDGEAYFQRCRRLLADFEEAESSFAGATPKGVLRVDVHGQLARHFLLPGLPAFLECFPGIELQLSEGDRLVDLVREGIDCVVRAGTPQDSDMIARRVAQLEQVTCASPDYVARFGLPTSLDALEAHRMVGFRSSLTGGVLPLEFTENGQVRELMLPAPVSMSGSDTVAAACRLGLGMIQVPRYRVAAELAQGGLVELLPQCPPPLMPVSLLYPRSRQLSPRVRVFMDWVSREFAEKA